MKRVMCAAALGLMTLPAFAQDIRIDDGGITFGDIRIDDKGVRVKNPDITIEADPAEPDPTPEPEPVVSSDPASDSIPADRRFVGSKMENADLSGRDLRDAEFATSDFDGADFSGADLRGAKFASSKFRGADFSGANLAGADFASSDFDDADFTGANLSEADIATSDFDGVNFTRACLLGVDVANSKMRNVNWTEAYLVDADFVFTRTNGGNLDAAVYSGTQECPGYGSRPEVTSAADIEQALVSGEGKADLTVNFALDSDQIQSQGHVQVYEIAQALKSDALKGARIGIEGHTDAQGEEAYNQDLSVRRALRVKRTLAEEYGIDGRLLEIKGYGESQPVASNATEEGRALNRRVTLVLLP